MEIVIDSRICGTLAKINSARHFSFLLVLL